MAHDGFQYSSEGFKTTRGFVRQVHSMADPMDLDIDFDLDGLSWANDLNYSLSNIGPQDLGPHFPVQISQPNSNPYHVEANPPDLLFLEDESTLPAYFDTGLHQETSCLHTVQLNSSAATLTAQRDGGPQLLRNQLALLTGGSCGDELVFRDCETSKAIALHSLAIEFGLNYSHHAGSSVVSISRIQNPPAPPSGQTQSTGLPAEPWIDDQLPLPGLQTPLTDSIDEIEDLDSLYEKFIQEPLSTKGLPPIPRYQLSESYLPSASASKTTAVLEIKSDIYKKSDDTAMHNNHTADQQRLNRQPSRSERIGRSISKHVTTWKTSMSKGGRRGPLTEDGRRDMKALEKAGGSCWRCKVLKRKCTPGITCRCCLQTVATPSVGEEAPLWPLIGCRRGKLRDSMVEQVLCPKSRGHRKSLESDRCGSLRSRRSVDSISDRCLLAAESQRLADMKAVLEGASYKLSITDCDMRRDFVSFVEAGRYRNQECLYRSYEFEEGTVTYAELIATIAWELAENKSVQPLLEIKSWKTLMNMLETACIYEAEVGQTSLVMISMICLRQCLQALRLGSAGILSGGAHDDCTSDHCQVHYIRDLLVGIRTYIDELSTVIFHKENMRDRRWWLSTFYSLYMQSYVRHALIAIEKQLCFPDLDDVPAEDLTSTQYLHLAGVLFTAASAKYDPLLGGQFQWALTDNSVIPETSIPELHHSSVRTACEVDKWSEAGIKSSYQFLRGLLQIGSLDFDELGQQQGDIQMEEPEGQDTMRGPEINTVGMGSLSLWNTTTSPTGASYESPRDNASFYQAPSFCSHRASFDSRYSVPSFTSMSNPSEESVARTFATDMTSIYEVSMADSKPLTMPSSAEGNRTSEPGPGQASYLRHGLASPTILPPVPPPDYPGSFTCGCCPKKPQSFHTAGELAHHESEKPHACSQPSCKMRFKGPKEAERHINAIHLKSDYWSCSRLVTNNNNNNNNNSSKEDASRSGNPLLAFYCKTFSDGTKLDVCGFCGGEFERKAAGGDDQQQGSLDDGGAVVSGVVDVDELVSHLDAVHKRGGCNTERKFYRVDNFRQHLKTAHVALPGKWLKILERNCRAGEESVAGGEES